MPDVIARFNSVERGTPFGGWRRRAHNPRKNRATKARFFAIIALSRQRFPS